MTHKKSTIILMALLINSLAAIELSAATSCTAAKKVCRRKKTALASCCDMTATGHCDKKAKVAKKTRDPKKEITITIKIDGVNIACDATADADDSDDNDDSDVVNNAASDDTVVVVAAAATDCGSDDGVVADDSTTISADDSVTACAIAGNAVAPAAANSSADAPVDNSAVDSSIAADQAI